MIIAGVISTISSIFIKGVISSFVFVGAILVALPIMIIYAYIIYRQEKNRE
jgi:hypothetical protein